MANICNVEIKIDAPKHVIEKLADAIDNDDNILQTLAPRPSDCAIKPSDFWGTRALSQELYSYDDDSLYLEALTAWSPPIEALNKALKTFPEIRKISCLYHEPLNGLLGYYHSGFGDTVVEIPQTLQELEALKTAHPDLDNYFLFTEVEIPLSIAQGDTNG
jgi:hypothetical protein